MLPVAYTTDRSIDDKIGDELDLTRQRDVGLLHYAFACDPLIP